MDYFANPATLGGVIAGVGLGAWVIGRWQAAGLLRADQGASQPAPNQLSVIRNTPAASPCQEQARAERQSALDHPMSLCELHDEVSAFRRHEKIFATIAADELVICGRRENDERDCRYIGLIGHPTCPAPGPARLASGCAKHCAAAQICAVPMPCAGQSAITGAERQPSPAVPAVTRV